MLLQELETEEEKLRREVHVYIHVHVHGVEPPIKDTLKYNYDISIKDM